MTRQRNDEQRKQQIRDAATRCFVRAGYEATRLLDIAREAGLSKGGVYFHYRAKETLFHDILEQMATAMQARWDFEPVAEQPADRTLARLVVAHLRTMQDEPDELRLQNLLVAMAAQHQAFRERLEQVVGIMRDLYAQVIERGITEGVFIVGDSKVMATSILAYVNGLGALTVLDPDGQLPVMPEQAAEQAVRMVKVHTSASAVEFASAAKRLN